jgi:tRNA(adenine34) deaminase
VALRAGAQARGRWYLDDVTAYVTLEPCVMCAGALVLARVKRVVFGCRDPKGGALVSAFTLGSSPLLNHQFVIEESLREGECREVLQSFFRDVRARRARERLSSK